MVKAKPTYVGIKDFRSMFCLNIAAKHTEFSITVLKQVAM